MAGATKKKFQDKGKQKPATAAAAETKSHAEKLPPGIGISDQERRAQAAIKLQAMHRGNAARKEFEMRRVKSFKEDGFDEAPTRDHPGRKSKVFGAKKAEHILDENSAARMIQAAAKRKSQRQEANWHVRTQMPPTLWQRVEMLKRELTLTGTMPEMVVQAARLTQTHLPQGTPLTDIAGACLKELGMVAEENAMDAVRARRRWGFLGASATSMFAFAKATKRKAAVAKAAAAPPAAKASAANALAAKAPAAKAMAINVPPPKASPAKTPPAKTPPAKAEKVKKKLGKWPPQRPGSAV